MTERYKKIKLLFDIFMTFFKISPVTFGGGFAMVPLLEREVVHNKKWIDKDEIVDTFAVSQSVPGAIAANSATFIGYQIAGVPGALAAVLGITIPTFVIVILLASVFIILKDNLYIQAAFKGIRPVIVALIAMAAYKMGKAALLDISSWVIGLIVLVSLLAFKKSEIFIVILMSGLSGIFILWLKLRIRQFADALKEKRSNEGQKSNDEATAEISEQQTDKGGR